MEICSCCFIYDDILNFSDNVINLQKQIHTEVLKKFYNKCGIIVNLQKMKVYFLKKKTIYKHDIEFS